MRFRLAALALLLTVPLVEAQVDGAATVRIPPVVGPLPGPSVPQFWFEWWAGGHCMLGYASPGGYRCGLLDNSGSTTSSDGLHFGFNLGNGLAACGSTSPSINAGSGCSAEMLCRIWESPECKDPLP